MISKCNIVHIYICMYILKEISVLQINGVVNKVIKFNKTIFKN